MLRALLIAEGTWEIECCRWPGTHIAEWHRLSIFMRLREVSRLAQLATGCKPPEATQTQRRTPGANEAG